MLLFSFHVDRSLLYIYQSDKLCDVSYKLMFGKHWKNIRKREKPQSEKLLGLHDVIVSELYCPLWIFFLPYKNLPLTTEYFDNRKRKRTLFWKEWTTDLWRSVRPPARYVQNSYRVPFPQSTPGLKPNIIRGWFPTAFRVCPFDQPQKPFPQLRSLRCQLT